jgi:hypothetical protein
LLGLQEKLFAFASHLLQEEQGISELLLIQPGTYKPKIDLSVMKQQLRALVQVQNSKRSKEKLQQIATQSALNKIYLTMIFLTRTL